jgi:murein DD-endopeptidase MepM/ murein hydrolase activator NlpD
MMRLKHSTRGAASFPLSFRHGALALFAVLAGGCSAEITRFDFPGFSLTDDKKETTTASLQEPNGSGRGPSYLGNEGRSGSSGNDRYTTPRSNNDANVAMAPLSEPQGGNQGGYGDDRRPAGAQPSYRAAPPRQGEAVDVQPGDTLYALSRRHHVSVAELMDVNSLSNPNLHPGQKIYLPAGYPAQAAGYPAQAVATPSAPTVQARQVATVAVPPSSVSPAVKAKYDGSYTVRDGESVYSIAKSVGVPIAELQRVNGITDARSVRAGTVLKVPGAGASSAVADAAPQPRTQVAVVPPAMDSDLTDQPAAPAASPRAPTVINRRNEIQTTGTEVATGTITPPAVQPRAVAGDNKLRWPVQGKILAAFGQRDDGTHNDGINLSVPQGTAVHAADAGTVAYAGSELKGYGNLVLVRHDNGWVTAYAHNDALLVKRGDKVQRGQVIAKAGRTGSVDQPQLHFELRQGSKPVDPVPFLERL